MITSIKLVLLYFIFQIAAGICSMILSVLYLLARGQSINMYILSDTSMPIALALGICFMGVYLWKNKYISKERVTWSPVSVNYLLLSVVFYIAFIFLVEYVLSLMPWLPNIMENSFESLQSNWLGVLCITILGPVLEELLFRGAITKALLKQYSPAKAIVFSALIFGIFHLNPVQIVSAGLIGFVLAWIYYKTASLVPCILLHILNNTLSVFLSLRYPEIEKMSDFFSHTTYLFIIGTSIAVCIGIYFLTRKIQVPYLWKEEQTNI